MAFKRIAPVLRVDAGRSQEQVKSWREQDSSDSMIEKRSSGQLLLQAAERGDAESVKLLLREADQLDPNLERNDGCTPLLLTVLNKPKTIRFLGDRSQLMYDSVAILLLADQRINPNCQDSDGRTPLSHAAELGYEDLVGHLLKHKEIDPNCQDKGGRTPLSYAAERGCGSLIEELLQHKKINPNCKDNVGQTPLSRAVAASQLQAVRMLIRHRLIPESKDKAGRTDLSLAMKCFEHENEAFMINKDPRFQIVELLLSLDNVDVNSQDKAGRTPLSWAITYLQRKEVNLPAVFQTLLDRSSESLPSKDLQGRTLLSRAAESGSTTVIKRLLEKKMNPDMKDDDGRTPLSRAAAEGHEAVVILLLQQKLVDPDSRDEAARTPLWWAAKGGHKAVIESLLAKKVDPDSMDQERCTPLLCAVMNKHMSVIKLLIKKDRVTLHEVAQKGAVSDVQLLLTQGSNNNARNIDGRTPLHSAVKSGHVDIAEELLSSKADINCKDTDGKTPLLLALEGKHHDLVQLFLKHSAETIGIMSAQWLDSYDKGQSQVVVDLSQTSFGRQSLQFVDAQRINVLSKMGPHTRLLIFPNYSTWSRYPPCNPDSILKLEHSAIFSGYKYYDSYHTVFVVGTFPTMEKRISYQSSPLVSNWSKQAIAWNIVQPSQPNDRSCWKSTEYFSTLSYGWIPAGGAHFFALFVRQLKVKWLEFGETAQSRLSQYRLDQLRAKGDNSFELIDCLARDAHALAELRNDFKGQHRSAQRFVVEYCSKYNDDSGRRTMQLEINQLAVDINEQFNQLDSTVKELLQFGFAWASINEARQSTSIATSIQRLSWITFVFLPAMFASSLFGMNVDVLQSNPDWRWYLLFGGGFLTLTVLAWLLSKYGQVCAPYTQEPTSSM